MGKPNEIAVVMPRDCKLKWTTIANVSYEVHSWLPCALLVGVQVNKTPLKSMLATPIQFKHMHTQKYYKRHAQALKTMTMVFTSWVSFRIEGPVWWVLSSPGSSKDQWFFCPMTWSVSGFRLFSNPTIPSDWTVGTLENQSVGREKSTQNTGVWKVRSEKNTFLTHFAFPRHQWRRGHMVTCSCKKAGGWFSPVFFL